jgi:diacylglycerol kinase (ATP)
MRWRFGWARHGARLLLGALLTLVAACASIGIFGSDTIGRLDAMLVAIGNGPSFGGGLRITEGALLDDGLLDVVIIKPMSKAGLVRTYPKLFKGTHVTHPQYEHHRVRSVTVAAPGIVAYADGERFGALPVTVECVPGALNVLS